MFGRSSGALSCAVITPVGPGHKDLFQECKASVEQAWRAGHGPFASMNHISIDDTDGRHGRSHARNIGVRRAAEQGADWILFLDADDLLIRNAFLDVAPFVEDHDALWGLIVGLSSSAAEPHLRMPQIVSIKSYEELLLFDPFLTLQMGHFVRTSTALENAFNESMDVGEDFDYYLRIWKRYRCRKVNRALFINRHSRRSSGPRSGSAEEWGKIVRVNLLEARAASGLLTPSSRVLSLKNSCIAEVQQYCREHKIVDHSNCVSLALQMPYRGYVDVTAYQGADFVLFTNNDDRAVTNLVWTGGYETLSCGLWQTLAKSSRTILDFGAEQGFFGLLAAQVAANADIHCFESSPETFARIRLNASLNGCANVKAVYLSSLNCEGPTPVDFNGAVADFGWVLSQSTTFSCLVDEYTRLNQIGIVDLVAVSAGRGEWAWLEGIRNLVETSRPDLLIRHPDPLLAARCSVWLAELGYEIFAIDDSELELTALETATQGRSGPVSNWFASVRGRHEVGRLAIQALGELVTASDVGEE